MSRVDFAGEALFDAAGAAVIETRPVPFGQRWRITRVTVTTTSTSATDVAVYLNTAQAPNLVDRTSRSGNSDTTDTPIDLVAGDRLVIVWAGGTPGATARMTASGEADQ